MIVPDINLEKSLWLKGTENVVGVDEAGKGPWAGPVTAGAVMIHSEKQVVSQVRDSKLMTSIQREFAFTEICKISSAYGIGIVSHEEIDKIGIDQAVKYAMILALQAIEKNFSLPITYVIIDGIRTAPIHEYRTVRIKAGGLYHYSISAASILAKVTRDRIMKKLSKSYPLYAFQNHLGYGTKIHQERLQLHGPCLIHRKSFSPVKKLLQEKEHIKNASG